MDRHTGTSDQVVNGARQVAAVNVTDTEWGYIIRPGENALMRAAYGEMAASFVAVLLGLSAYGLWLLPNSTDVAALLPFKIAGTAIFFVMAAMLYLIARRGLCYEVHVDLQRKVLRTARRNRHGRATAVRSVPISEIESVFLQRAQTGFMRSRLCVRVTGERGLTEVAVGYERTLAPILDRMARDLRKQTGEVPMSMRAAPSTKLQVRSAFAAR